MNRLPALRRLSSNFHTRKRIVRCSSYSTDVKNPASGSDDVPQNTPLAGVRILDLTRVLAGPYCTMILGDLGAEIIKVEKPGVGDDTRGWVPPWVQSESAYFLSINRNKQSIAVNFKSPEGQKIVQELVSKSDVLVENYIPGKLSEMNLGYEDLKSIHPSLIYCSITGYGQTGPYKDRAGYDVIAAGLGGLMHITGPEDGEPCRVGVAMTDLSTGLYAYGAIMAALLYRQRTGKGQHIDCNLLSTQVATLTHIASNFLNAGLEAKRYGSGHGSIVPYQSFQTADSYIQIGAGNNRHFKDLCQRLGLEKLAEDPKYDSNQNRVKNRKELIPAMNKRFNEKSTGEWMEIFEGCGFPYGPINSMEQVFSDPQVLHNGMIQEMEHSTVGPIRLPGPAVRYSESTTVLQHPPPTLGQHTEVILRDILQYQPQHIDKLIADKVIAIPNNGTTSYSQI